MAAKLIETDEEVEKARFVPRLGGKGLIPKGQGPKRRTADAANENRIHWGSRSFRAGSKGLKGAAATYWGRRNKFKRIEDRVSRGIRKSNADPISDLYTAIEKARGKTGARAFRGVRMSAAQRRSIASGKLKPGSRITRGADGSYLLPGWGRKGNLSAHVVRKTADPIDALYEAFEKAKPLLARQKNGTRMGIINGKRVRLSRPMKAYGGRKFSIENPTQPGRAIQLKETTYSLPKPSGGDQGKGSFRNYQRSHIKGALARLKAQPHPSTIAPGGGRINSKRNRK